MIWNKTVLFLILVVVLAATGNAQAGAASAAPSAESTSLPSLRHEEGKNVSSIELLSPALSETERKLLLESLPQKQAQPLDRELVRNSLRALMDSGKFSDVALSLQPAGDAVGLVFDLEPNFFVGGLFIDGVPRHAPRAAQLLTTSKLELGELYTEQKIATAHQRMQQLLAENGYHQTQISEDLARHPETQQIDIYFHVKHGEIAKVGQIDVTGQPGFTPDEVKSILKLKTGNPVDRAKLRKGLERMRSKYQKRDRLEAQIEIARTTYHAESNTVDFVVNIERGPAVQVEVQGARMRKGLLKKYVPVYEENAVDDDLLNEGRRNLRDYFQSKGYFEVKLDYQEKNTGPDNQNIIYTVDRGKQHTLRLIAIDGNTYFREEDIRERMDMQQSNYLLRHGRFSQSMLNRDVEAIKSLYRENGFQNVNVTARTVDNYLGKGEDLAVFLHIEAGPQTLVSKLTVEGSEKITEQQIRDQINAREGQPFSETLIATDRDSVVSYYFNHGFPSVQFTATYQPDATDAKRMGVTYKIVEGEQVFVDRVLVSGLHFTHPFVVDRELQLRSGQPLSQRSMFETQRRLYDLSIFNEVDVAVQNPDGAAQRKNVLLQLEEAKRWTFNYGFGFDVQTGLSQGSSTPQPQGRTGISPSVSFDVTRLNFRGRDQTLLFKSRYSRLQRRFLASFEAPRYLSRDNLRFTATAFYDNTRDVKTFTAERVEGSAQVEQILSRATTMLYRFAFRRVKVDPTTLVIDPNLIPLLSKPVRVGIPSLTFVHDKRDDPIDAHNGNYTTVDAGVASRIFYSEASFARLFVQNNSYHPIAAKKWVFARSTRLGIEEPFGNRSQNFVPLPERFFAGGGNSLRGFAINQAGPRDLQTGFPLGGETLFVNNFELRTPPLPLPFVEDNLSAVIFHDMGNVYASAKDLFPGMLRFQQRHPGDCKSSTATVGCDFNYLSQQVGLGLRYKTPIGPVRVDFGVNLNPPVFPIKRENRFERLKSFNFVFSIGQAF